MNSATKILFHGGIGTIGGTKIIVEEGGHRVLFDFGLSYGPSGDYWGGNLQVRRGTARLRDFVRLGYAPATGGIYRKGEAERLGLTPAGDGRTQVFISHLHLDHMAIVDLLDESVPVWMHADSLRLFRAVADTGEPPSLPGGVRPFAWGEPIKVGPMTVTAVAVDHDIPGASALFIHTSAGTVVYTGDLRLHGANPERMDAFIEAARSLRPRILLIEGTRLSDAESSPDRPPTLSEPDVPARFVEHLQGVRGLALATMYPRNPERIANVAAAVREAGRLLVVAPEVAYVCGQMGYPLPGTGLYQCDRHKLADAEGTQPPWATQLFASGRPLFDADRVRASQDQILLQLNYTDLFELVDLDPAPGSVFIHSNGEPLGRFDPNFDLLDRWLARYQIPILYAPSTGHASAQALSLIASAVRPDILMPIHSRHPELLDVPPIRRILPELDAAYSVATGERLQ